jgi:8-oxo-dGTP pyrophosphatase MutT (NUDIX family)
MLDFRQGENRFLYRTAAVFVNRSRVLLHQFRHDSFWAVPGGRVEHGEAAGDALRREMEEELSINIKDIRPIWCVDTFFEHQGQSCHEIGIYFLVSAPSDSYIY